MNHNKQQILEAAEAITAAGYKVFLSHNGEYAYFTDGGDENKVISFHSSLLTLSFGGNYKTDNPKKTGVGWEINTIADIAELTPEGIRNIYEQSPLRWAVGMAKWEYTTAKQFRETYQKSSRYTEFKSQA